MPRTMPCGRSIFRRRPRALLVAIAITGTIFLTFASPVRAFVRGDANGDGTVDFLDLGYTLEALLHPAGSVPLCLDAIDIDDDGILDLRDPIRLAQFILGDGDPPAAPYPNDCTDPTRDLLGDCEPPNDGRDVPFTVVATGLRSGYPEQRCYPNLIAFTITHADDWREFWDRHVISEDTLSRRPEIDFEREQVIVIIQTSPTYTLGQHIEVFAITERCDSIEAEVLSFTLPHLAFFPTCVEPFVILRVPLLPVGFEVFPRRL